MAIPARFQAFLGVAKIIGISITSGGIGKKELSIKDVKDEVITYVYDNKEYEAYYKDDLYLLGSSPFTC